MKHSTSMVRAGVDLRRFPWVRPLAADYVHRFAALSPFFSGDPREVGAWRAAITDTLQHSRRRHDLVEVVHAQQARRGAPEAARSAARQLEDPRAVAIVTGQQAGLFGGPLYTLLKAITTIRLAEKMSRLHDLPVVPVFWIDAEDHDWDEIAGCGVLDQELGSRTVTVARPERAGHVPVGWLRLDSSIEQTLRALEASLTRTEFTPSVITGLEAAYREGISIVDAFGAWLETVLGARGLVVFDSSDARAKPLARPVFERELSAPGRTSELASTAGRELVALGYHAQVEPQPDTVAMFHLNSDREPIRRTPEGFLVGDRPCAGGQLLDEIASRPDRFSPNVLLRPVVQDALFPTVCYVAGPNELAYLAQLGPVYAHFGIPMPLIYPRASATIVDAAAARFLAKYETALESLQPQDEAVLNRLLESQLPRTVEEALGAAAEGIRSKMEAVIAAVPAIDPTLEGAARSTLGRLEHDLGVLHTKIIQAAKRRHDVLRRQFAHTRAQVFPGGQPQERALGFVYFLNQYGPALIDRLLDELPLDVGQHWVVTI